MKKAIMILAGLFVFVLCSTTTHAKISLPDGNKLNTSPFHHNLHDSDSDSIEDEEDVGGGNGAWHSDDDDQMNEADSDGIEDADGSYDGVDWINDDPSVADTDGDGSNEDEDACPWGDEADGEKCVANIKLEDLFPF